MNGKVDYDSPGERCRVGHRALLTAHTAALEAAAPCLSVLFDEIAMGLAELTSGADAGAPASSWERVTLEAADLPDLLCAWLNELVACAATHRSAFVDVAVDRVESPANRLGCGWRLLGRAGLRAFRRPDESTQHGWTAVTRGGLSLHESEGTWTLRARLDPAESPRAVDDHQGAWADNASQPPGSGEGRTLGTHDESLVGELPGIVDTPQCPERGLSGQGAGAARGGTARPGPRARRLNRDDRQAAHVGGHQDGLTSRGSRLVRPGCPAGIQQAHHAGKEVTDGSAPARLRGRQSSRTPDQNTV